MAPRIGNPFAYGADAGGGPAQVPASLQGTLAGADLIDQLEKFQLQQQAELQSRSQAATEGAMAAQQQYQQQAAAPVQQLDPSALFFPTLLSGIASVLTQDKGFQQRAQEGIQAKRGDLLKARADNLQSLRDVYSQRADEAQKSGDLELQEKYRTKIETISKAYDAVQQSANRHNQAMIAAEDRASRERIASIREESKPEYATPPEVIKDLADSVLSGQTKITDYLGRDRDDIVRNIAQRGEKILPPKARDTLQTLKAARVALKQITRLSQKVNTGSGAQGYTTGAKRALQGALQQKPEVVAFNAKTKGLLATLARSTGERGTLATKDVDRARELMPKIFTSKEAAAQLLSDFDEWITEMENETVKTYTTKTPQQGGEAVETDNDPLGIR